MSFTHLLSEELKSLLIKEGVAHEGAVINEDSKNDKRNEALLSVPFAEVHFTMDGVKNVLPIVVDFSGHHRFVMMIKDVKGEIFIVYPQGELSKGRDLTATIAHELGHYRCGHLSNPDHGTSFPNLYRDELFKAHHDGDQDQLTYWSVKAVIDGGYLTKELEADTVAVKAIGLERVIAMHVETTLDMTNFVTIIEKHNRIKQLNQLYHETSLTEMIDPDFLFEIVWKFGSLINEQTKSA